ncbi:hypothetical protein [Nibribacter koreensis]|uniref:Uncharacterized protein n=1 Tax=Nibribacter koreensis TaxID=1084519 RepID=A0ABP8FU89_9BACT
MQQHLALFDPFEKMQFGYRTCFLCGNTITQDQVTQVFPEWLMQEYDITERPLQMLDQSVVQFKDLQVPCCRRCQTQYIQPLEEQVQAAAQQGVAGLRALEPKLLFQWLGKMFYGTLINELIKEQDPLIKPEYAVSEQPKMLMKFQSFFKVLQSLRVPMTFADFLPGSIFVVDVDAAAEPSRFEFRDDLTTMMISLRLDNAMIVCCLLDNELLKRAMRRVWAEVEPRKLQPIQAAEFSARVFYGAYLLNVIPDYLPRQAKPQDEVLVMDSLIDDVTDVIFNPWENSAYAKMLALSWARWGVTQADILKDPEAPISMLFTPAGEFVEFPEVPGQA